MENFEIYNDIAKRTNGDIYIGIVGPVRTGKSTFITKFMQEMVLPNMTAKKKVVELAYSDDDDLEALLTAICGPDFFTQE